MLSLMLPADVYKDARVAIDVGHFYAQEEEPRPHWIGHRAVARFTWWTRLRTVTHRRAVFVSLVLVGHFQCYWGTAKCDGTRSLMARDGQLGEPRLTAPQVIMTNAPSEMAAFRWRSARADISVRPEWKGMGSG